MVCNKQQIGAYAVAETFGVPTLYMDRKTFYESEKLLQELKDRQVDFIVLAGFLWLIPSYLVKAFPNKILNIHPALLPKYGGKGMYGHHVHEAVKAAGEVESGMTIHYVNEHYDEGNIIFQSKCALEKDDSAEEIARKVLSLEHLYYPKVIEEVLKISNKKASLGQT
jgi:phosphoribosylglycinamide formyltransferase-1